MKGTMKNPLDYAGNVPRHYANPVHETPRNALKPARP